MPAQLQTLSLSRLSRLRRQELIERRVLRLIFLGLVVLSLAGLLYLTQASAVTTTTYEIQELQHERERLLRGRDRLRAEIAVLTSPENVEARAQALGFRAAPPAEFLVVTEVPIQQMADGRWSVSPLVVWSSSHSIDLSTRLPDYGTTRPPDHPAIGYQPLETLLTRASTWLQGAMSLLPAPQQVEAGSAHQ